MAVETRVVIDANASNAIKEIGRLDEAAQDADKTIKQLDDQTVTVAVNADGMDELRQKGDDAVESIRKLSDTPVDVNDGGAADKLDRVAKSANSSKSVLANMVGNATQDLGALGGIAGSTGVAIGQMGEYMVDAANDGDKMGDVFRNFAQVAGPIAALSAGVFLLTEGMQAFNAPSKAAAERTKALGDAMDKTGDDSVAFANVLRKSTDALSDFIAQSNDPLGRFGVAVDEVGSKIPIIGSQFKEAGVNIFDASKRAGLGVYDLGKQIAGTGQTTEQFNAQLQAAADAGKISGDEMRAVSEAIAQYSDSAAQAAKDQGLFNVNAAEANAILQSMADPLDRFAAGFAVIKSDLADGAINAEVTATTINALADALGMTTEQVIALADQDLKGDLENTAASAGTASEKTRELAEKYGDAARAADNLKHANELLRGDISQDQDYLHLQDQFDQTKRKGKEAMDAVRDGASDADSKMRIYQESVNDSKLAVIDFNDTWSNVDTDQQLKMVTKIERGQLDSVLVDVGHATSTTHWIDVRVRTSVDAAWNAVTNRLGGTRGP